MHIAIFGGAGFIGSELTHQLISRGSNSVFIFDNFTMGNKLETLFNDELTVFTGDCREQAEVQKFLEYAQPEIIFHLVANSDIRKSSNDPNLEYENTFLSTCNILFSLRNLAAPHLVFASSSAIFGNSISPSHEDSRKEPVSSYGWMKLASELVVETALTSDLLSKYSIIRFPNVVGPRLTHGVIYDFLHSLRKNRDTLSILGDGFQNKPYMHSSDLVKVMLKLVEDQVEPKMTLNIAPQGTTSVRKIVEILRQELQLDFDAIYGDSTTGWNGDVPKYAFDTSKLFSIFSDLELMDSETAIRRAIRENKQSILEIVDKPQ